MSHHKKSNKRPREDIAYDDDTGSGSSEDVFEDDLKSFRSNFANAKEETSDSDLDTSDESETEDGASPKKGRFDSKLSDLKKQLSSLKKVNDDDTSGSEVDDPDEETLPPPAKREVSSKRRRVVVETSGNERLAIRTELSKMSIEELQKMKEKIGLKLYNKMLGLERKPTEKVHRSNELRNAQFKRENKNRPRETFCKKTVGRYRDVVGLRSEQKLDKRDPRFDNLCGDFDEKVFKDSYKFVENIKRKELATLKEKLRREDDPEEIRKIKYLIQRMENQQREKLKMNKRKEIDVEQRKRNRELVKRGEKPQYLGKRERQNMELVDKYKELKHSGKLDAYMEKKNKKLLAKDRMMMLQGR